MSGKDDGRPSARSFVESDREIERCGIASYSRDGAGRPGAPGRRGACLDVAMDVEPTMK